MNMIAIRSLYKLLFKLSNKQINKQNKTKIAHMMFYLEIKIIKYVNI